MAAEVIPEVINPNQSPVPDVSYDPMELHEIDAADTPFGEPNEADVDPKPRPSDNLGTPALKSTIQLEWGPAKYRVDDTSVVEGLSYSA